MIKMLRPRVAMLDTRIAISAMEAKGGGGDPFYYSKAWRKLLASIISKRGRRCEDPTCKQPNMPSKIYGDHIVERRDDPSRELDETNIMLRCPPCHGRKTAIEAARRKKVAPP